MVQYGWRIGSVAAGALALVLAARAGWEIAYLACAAFAFPSMLTGLLFGEPARHRAPKQRRAFGEALHAVYGHFTEFFLRQGAFLVLLFILLHQMGEPLVTLPRCLLHPNQGY